MRIFGRFHDGCIREIHVVTGHSVDENLAMTCDWPTTVRMLVQRQNRNPSAIELRFDEVVELRLSPPPPDYVQIIFECHFSFEEGVFYWADDVRFDAQSKEHYDYSWISARRVWWRDASQWMGETLRYSSD